MIRLKEPRFIRKPAGLARHLGSRTWAIVSSAATANMDSNREPKKLAQGPGAMDWLGPEFERRLSLLWYDSARKAVLAFSAGPSAEWGSLLTASVAAAVVARSTFVRKVEVRVP